MEFPNERGASTFFCACVKAKMQSSTTDFTDSTDRKMHLPFSLTRLNRKSEIRISKSETNPKSELEKNQLENGRLLHYFSSSDFGFVSDFGFRHSDFISATCVDVQRKETKIAQSSQRSNVSGSRLFYFGATSICPGALKRLLSAAPAERAF